MSLIIFMIGFSVGFGCIPFLLMGELFPTAQRSLLSSLAGSFNLAVMFAVIKTYHPLEDVQDIQIFTENIVLISNPFLPTGHHNVRHVLDVQCAVRNRGDLCDSLRAGNQGP